ncbi:replication protein A 70 kDa DNA-binding subunit B-like [Coffea arabica]|uniref:Replication protein A 70 kDa DNA-binding subunit B-like n=1 Tax=Coffea arabica TaxID=13443 RepID=A0ABM4WN91_COFAR
MEKLLSIKEIVPDMQDWSCKVIVQEKQQITQSLSTPTKKQKLIFVDTEGSKVEGIIFNHDISRVGPILQVYKKYKITNAVVRPIDSKYQTAELTMQWILTSKTVIEEDADDEDIMPVKFNYTQFTDLAQYVDRKDKSVAAYCLHVRSQAVMLSMWDDFIKNEGQQIIAEIGNYPVIICRRLKVNNYNGVALSTWFDSAILVDPPVQEARELKNWAIRNTKLLAAIIDEKSYIKYNPQISAKPDQKTILISNVRPSQKNIWVKARFSFQHIFQKYWYMSCKKCCRGTAAADGVIFMCNTCKEKHPAQPRCRFDMDLCDDTGAITASVFGEQAEKLLKFTALEIMDHFKQNIELPLEAVHKELESKWFLIHIKPVQAQMSDAKQRYTVIYYSELLNSDAVDSPAESKNAESKNPTLLIELQSDTADIVTSATTPSQETKPASKARQCLTQKLELLADEANNTSRSVSEGSKKKSRLM